jgi:hypothetical protein
MLRNEVVNAEVQRHGQLVRIAPEIVKSEYGSVASRRSRHVPNESRTPTAPGDLQPWPNRPRPIAQPTGHMESAFCVRSYVPASSM